MNNNIFRLVFSKKLGMLVPVAETSASQGKTASGEASVASAPKRKSTGPSAEAKATHAAYSKQRLAASVALLVTFWGATWGSVGWAQALPQGGAVTNGQGAVSTSANHMTVTQQTQVLGMTWQSFNIGAGNTVQFVQPSSSAVAINQVLGNSRSEIFGNLQANGRVFLLNPNGVLFGSTAQVDVGALVASTARSINQDANGQWVLGQTGPGSIINQGHIRAQDGGFVVLAGSQVRNEGTIQANGGGVALAVGETVSIDISQGRQLSIKVDGDVLNALVENQGVILADGGAVYLTAKGRETLLQTVVNNGGVIQARSLVEREGRILLLGTGGDTINSGTLDASGQVAGAKGGAVVMGGNRVAVEGTQAKKAIIDVSGVAGGGRAIIGGDLLGKATDLASIGLSDVAVVGSNAEIRIGSAQGDGGFVETSGKSLTMLGTVNGQSAGKNGEWLIDPNDVTISTAADAAMGSGPLFAPTGTGAGVVSNASIESALNSGTNVCVTTAGSGTAQGNITVNANITKTGGGNATLTLAANRSITISSTNVSEPRTISSSCGTLNVNLIAVQAGATNGAITLTNATINTNGGMLNMSAHNGGTTISATNVTLNIAGGTFQSTATGGNSLQFINVSLTTQGSGMLTINATNTNGNAIRLLGNTSITQLGSGAVNITGISTSTNGGHHGISLGGQAGFKQSGMGDFNITATGNVGHGLFSEVTDLSVPTFVQTSTGVMNINATSTGNNRGAHLQSNTTVVQSGDGTLNINATSNTGANGLILMADASITQSGNGTLNINTTNAAGGKTVFRIQDRAGIKQEGNGTIHVDASAFDMAGATTSFLNQTGAGNITINTTGNVALTQVVAGNLSVNAGNTITLFNNISKRDSADDATLNLTANHSITMANRRVSATTGKLHVNLVGANENKTAVLNLQNSNITTNGGNLNITYADLLTASGNAGGNALTLNNTTLNIGAGTGNINISGTRQLLSIQNSNLWAEGGQLNINGNFTRAAAIAGGPRDVAWVQNINSRGNVSISVNSSTGRNANNEAGAHSLLRVTGVVTAVNGNLSLNGNASGVSDYVGVLLLVPTLIAEAGNISVNGSAMSVPGIGKFGGGKGIDVIQNGSGNFSFTGTSNGSVGMMLSDINITQGVNSSGASISFNGISTGAGSGLVLSNATVVQQSNATLNLNGTAVTGVGINFASGSVNQEGNGTINVNGFSQTGPGTALTGTNIIQSGTGVINISGNSTASTGLFINSGLFEQTDAGTLNFTGNSTNATGLATTGGVIRQSGAGNVTLAGTSGQGDGVVMTGATQLGTVVTNQTTVLNVGGTLTNTTVNTTVTRTVNTTHSDLTDVVITTVTNDEPEVVAVVNGVLDGALRLNQTGTGNLTISGSSGNGTGVSIASAFISQSAGSNLTIAGESTNGTGLAMGGGALGSSTFNVTTNSTTVNATNNLNLNTLTVSNVSSNAVVNTSDASLVQNVTVNTTNITHTDLTNSTEVNRSTTTTTTTSNLLAPKMVFNTSAAGATINLNGTSAGVAGLVVQGDMRFDVATGTNVVLTGVTTGANSGPGVLVSGRTVNSSASSTVTSSCVTFVTTCLTAPFLGLTNATTVSDSTTNLTVPVTMLVDGPGGAVSVLGTSAGTGPGVFVGSESTLNASSVGALVVNGTSSSGAGVQMGGAQLTTTQTSTTNVASTGSWTLNSTSSLPDPIPTSSSTVAESSTVTVLGSTTYNVTLAGNVTVSGNTSTGTAGVQIGGNPGSNVLYVPSNITSSRDAAATTVGTDRIQTCSTPNTCIGGVFTTTQTGAVNDTTNYTTVTDNATGTLTIVGPVNIIADGNLSAATGTTVDVTGDATLSSTDTVRLAGNLTSSGGNVSITAVNDVVAPGNITSAGNLSISSTEGDVNTSGGTLVATNDVVIAASTGNLTLGDVTAGSNLAVNAQGNIVAPGTVTVGGNTNLNSTTGNVSLTNTANNLQGLTTVSAANGSSAVFGANNLVLPPNGLVMQASQYGLEAGGLSAFSGTLVFREALNEPVVTLTPLMDLDDDQRLRFLMRGLNLPEASLIDASELQTDSTQAPR